MKSRGAGNGNMGRIMQCMLFKKTFDLLAQAKSEWISGDEYLCSFSETLTIVHMNYHQISILGNNEENNTRIK